jgi:hypothetical protein
LLVSDGFRQRIERADRNRRRDFISPRSFDQLRHVRVTFRNVPVRVILIHEMHRK